MSFVLAGAAFRGPGAARNVGRRDTGVACAGRRSIWGPWTGAAHTPGPRDTGVVCAGAAFKGSGPVWTGAARASGPEVCYENIYRKLRFSDETIEKIEVFFGLSRCACTRCSEPSPSQQPETTTEPARKPPVPGSSLHFFFDRLACFPLVQRASLSLSLSLSLSVSLSLHA